MKENNVKSSVIGGLIWKFGERFLSQGVSFIISLVLARLLVPDDYGIIALVTVFINLSAVFISSGYRAMISSGVRPVQSEIVVVSNPFVFIDFAMAAFAAYSPSALPSALPSAIP